MGLTFRWRKFKNGLALLSLGFSSLILIIPLFLIFAYVLKNGIGALSLEFFTEMPKPVGETGGGMKNAILGTIYIVTIGGLIGVPWGMGAGVYLSEYGRGKFATFLRLTTDLLSGVPSIVIGIFVYALLVVPFKGFSALAGGVALSIIVLPITIRTTEEVLKLIPKDVREAGLALGMPRWKVIIYVVLRGAKSGLGTGVILSLARASGETAPLLFTAFGSMYLSYNAMEPMASLPVQIYNYAISPYSDWHKLAWGGSFVLILFILVLNLAAKFVVNYNEIREKFRKKVSA